MKEVFKITHCFFLLHISSKSFPLEFEFGEKIKINTYLCADRIVQDKLKMA